MTRLLLPIVILGSVLTLVPGCDRRNLEAVGQESTPFILILSPAYGTNAEAVQALQNHIATETGLAVDIRVAQTSQAAVNMIGSPYFDAGLLPVFDYLFCHQEFGVQAALQLLRADSSATYRGEILVRADSNITELAGLEGRRIAFVDRFSTSGFLFPSKLLRDAGVSVESSFAGSHDAALQSLRAGEVDAAAVYAGASGGDPAFRSIATTTQIPNEPVFFRPGLDAQIRQQVVEALMSLAASESGRRVLAEEAGITGFVPTQDETYREVHALIQEAGRNVEDFIPEGWALANELRGGLENYAP